MVEPHTHSSPPGLHLLLSELQVRHMTTSAFPGDYQGKLWNNMSALIQTRTAGPSLPLVAGLRPCVSFPSAFPALTPRYAAPPPALINHRRRRVTFALFKRILQTLAFRKQNHLPFHTGAANIPASAAVYSAVFVYRLTFLLCL